MKPIRVLVAEDHPLVRAGICAMLKALSQVQVVAQARDGIEALAMVRAHRPDVVLMDISMPHLDGLRAAEQLTKEFPEVRVIVLSMYADARHVQHAVRAGASGYLIKDLAAELEPAVRAVAGGKTFFSAAVAPFTQRGATWHGPEANHPESLTPRQREILQLIARGHTTKEVAHKLNISVKTAETHRTQLMERLDVHDVAGLVRYAIRVGLASAEK